MATTPHALARFHEFLRGRSLRVTGVREGIVRAALARKGHFDVDELTADARAQGIDASRATVYRMLPLLLQAGLIHETVSHGASRRYEAAAGQHHDHLVCTRCGRIVEFQFEAFAFLEREVAAKYGFALTGHSHTLLGECGACRSRSAQP